ncbi:L-2-hydroxyglutarate oxidase [Parapedobacter indicus]|uniref:L-2-hydroxyglutarate oxidase n=1 Tax=Parapedobacter indicus TaxID=1477437 RepID=A0A1I3TBS6_9SPHI|nr:L-2-hydroxyglutarate oxidase [Parapedobacter indicus]PPK99550.1 L-2-hydroxyglutarate oxidase [Parapedobacter indicus]SFJ68415.1 L-2-hydroxyglutarate oxidase [Parapedobacter indicus]
MIAKQYDVVVIGAGLVGLATAYRFLQLHPTARVLIIEKEAAVAQHQSGHNSGVIHSGIYYKPGSLKAINCINGYADLIRFAKEYGIAYELCGKLIVATSPEEGSALNNIFNRGIQNGLQQLRLLTQAELKEFEPHAAGIAAIHVPQTGIIDYPAMARRLQELIEQAGGEFVFSEKVMSVSAIANTVTIETEKQSYTTKQAVTCAGLQSDRVASYTDATNDLRIIPFRGEYYKLKPEKEYLVKNLIYPVPDPKFPFLGVHFTRMISGGVEAGPNAVLAFKREGYRFSSLDIGDTLDTLAWPGFWKIVGKYGRTGMGEIYRSLSKSAFTKALQKLLPEIQESDLVPGGAGVRAQACDRQGNLIDDFNILRKENIIHVRNAPSPAATSCLSIGQYITNQLIAN